MVTDQQSEAQWWKPDSPLPESRRTSRFHIGTGAFSWFSWTIFLPPQVTVCLLDIHARNQLLTTARPLQHAITRSFFFALLRYVQVTQLYFHLKYKSGSTFHSTGSCIGSVKIAVEKVCAALKKTLTNFAFCVETVLDHCEGTLHSPSIWTFELLETLK